MKKHKIVVGVTAASGAIYANILFEKLKLLEDQIEACGVIFSSNARTVWKYELENADYQNIPWKIYDPDDFFAPMASGSAGYNTMIICPCTVGTLGRIAHGVSSDLITRSADVVLKEKGRLILALREMPLNLIHISNMQLLTAAGAIICPASPSFYSRPKDLQALASTVVDRVLKLAGFELPHYKWQEDQQNN